VRPLSRQAKSGYLKDLDRLRAIVNDAPLLVTFDFDQRQFCVAYVMDPGAVLHRGRYQVMHAWLSGYMRGRFLHRDPRT
jgi:hypothetical protein